MVGTHRGSADDRMNVVRVYRFPGWVSVVVEWEEEDEDDLRRCGYIVD